VHAIDSLCVVIAEDYCCFSVMHNTWRSDCCLF